MTGYSKRVIEGGIMDLNDKEREIDAVIAAFKANREAEKIAQENKKFLDRQAFETAKLEQKTKENVAESNLRTSETIKQMADSNLNAAKDQATKSQLDSKEKVLEAQADRIKADADLSKAKADLINNKSETERKKIDLESLKESNKLQRDTQQLEERKNKEFRAFADDLDKIKESFEGPIKNLLDSISNATKFDVRKKPVTGIVATAAMGLNSIATQDRTPPIYGMLAKLVGSMAVFTSFYGGKGIGALVNHILGRSKQDIKAKELVKSDPVLKEIAETNKKLALQMAHLKIASFRQFNELKYSKERAEFFERENTKAFTFKENTVKESIIPGKNKQEIIQGSNNVETKLDDIISIVKSIRNQYDPETDTERYNAEVKWRSEVLSKLESSGSINNTKEKSGLGLLEIGALAGIGSYVSSILKSMTGFITPLLILARGLTPLFGPLALAGSMLLSLNFQKDLIDPVNSIVDTFKSGNILEGITKGLLFPVEVILKFIDRSIAYVSSLFGFDELSIALNENADKLNLFKIVSGFTSNLVKHFDSLLVGINESFGTELNSIKSFFNNTIQGITKNFEQFNLSKSINELFAWISDKIESLKFWKTDKEFKTPNFIENAVNTFKSNVTDKISNNVKTITRIEDVESSIKKIESNNINTLNNNFNKVNDLKEQKDLNRIKEIIEKTTTQIITPISNTQINNSNTAIASRPRARIEEITGQRSIFNNNSGNFSGFVMG